MPATLYACRDAQSTTHTLDRAARHPCSLDPERLLDGVERPRRPFSWYAQRFLVVRLTRR